MQRLIIAIDGPVGAGKSTVARRVAELLGYLYLDSGAMYRALALAALRAGLSLADAARLEALAAQTRIELQPDPSSSRRLRVLLNGEDVSEAIRSTACAQAASQVAQHASVRQHLVAEQRRLGAAGGVVMEGRDIGTAVFPDAHLKIFLDASVEERARRRLSDHRSRGENIPFEQMLAEVRERDWRDRTREVSPLVRAPDAVYLDSTALDAEEVARLIALLARRRSGEAG